MWLCSPISRFSCCLSGHWHSSHFWRLFCTCSPKNQHAKPDGPINEYYWSYQCLIIMLSNLGNSTLSDILCHPSNFQVYEGNLGQRIHLETISFSKTLQILSVWKRKSTIKVYQSEPSKDHQYRVTKNLCNCKPFYDFSHCSYGANGIETSY